MWHSKHGGLQKEDRALPPLRQWDVQKGLCLPICTWWPRTIKEERQRPGNMSPCVADCCRVAVGLLVKTGVGDVDRHGATSGITFLEIVDNSLANYVITCAFLCWAVGSFFLFLIGFSMILSEDVWLFPFADWLQTWRKLHLFPWSNGGWVTGSPSCTSRAEKQAPLQILPGREMRQRWGEDGFNCSAFKKRGLKMEWLQTKVLNLDELVLRIFGSWVIHPLRCLWCMFMRVSTTFQHLGSTLLWSRLCSNSLRLIVQLCSWEGVGRQERWVTNRCGHSCGWRSFFESWVRSWTCSTNSCWCPIHAQSQRD